MAGVAGGAIHCQRCAADYLAFGCSLSKFFHRQVMPLSFLPGNISAMTTPLLSVLSWLFLSEFAWIWSSIELLFLG